MTRCRRRCAPPGIAMRAGALAEAGAPADRVARQMLRVVSGLTARWMTGWWTGWPGPRPAGGRRRGSRRALTRAVASSWPGWHAGRLASRSLTALSDVGDTVRAEQVATQALEHAAEPDVLVDLHWTLAQCRTPGRGSRGIPGHAGSCPGSPRDPGPASRPAPRPGRADALSASARSTRPSGCHRRAGRGVRGGR